MNVRACGRAGHSRTKGQKGDAIAAQVIYQRSAFCAVGVHGYVYGVAMIDSHAIVRRGLTVRADRKLSAKFRCEKVLHV